VGNRARDRLVGHRSICDRAADFGGFLADANHVTGLDRVDHGIARATVDPIPEDFVRLRHGKTLAFTSTTFGSLALLTPSEIVRNAYLRRSAPAMYNDTQPRNYD
jgi:hypothetical protein